jgi:hypothetical protein
MFDLLDLPSWEYGKYETNQVFRRDLPARKRADYFLRPDLERLENLIAEADDFRRFSRLAAGQTRQPGVRNRIAEWLVALGCRIESYGNRLAVQSPASQT